MENTENAQATTYQPEIWQVEKDVIYAAIPSVEAGLEYAKELLAAHDRDLGRTTLKNKTWAETIEADIRHMTRTLEMLRACGTNNDSVTLEESRAVYQAGYLTQRRGSFRIPNPYPAGSWQNKAWDQGYVHARFHEENGMPHLHISPNVKGEPR
jgi:hypothetical protein